MEENTNINNEAEESVQDDSLEADTANEEAETSPSETTPDDDEESKVPFHKQERWQKIIKEKDELRTQVDSLKTQFDTLKTLFGDQATEQEKNEAWDKIKKLDEEGFSSYQDLAQLVSQFVKTEIEKEDSQKQAEYDSLSKANINQMNTDLNLLKTSGLLVADEQDDFVQWCIEKLEETKDEKNPQGNISIYGDLPRAISFYRHYLSQTKTDTDPKKRLEQAHLPASGTSENTTKKLTLADAKKLNWGDVKFGL